MIFYYIMICIIPIIYLFVTAYKIYIEFVINFNFVLFTINRKLIY